MYIAFRTATLVLIGAVGIWAAKTIGHDLNLSNRGQDTLVGTATAVAIVAVALLAVPRRD